MSLHFPPFRAIWHGALCLCAPTLAAFADIPEQPAELAPQRDGVGRVIFRIHAPGVERVYLAGSFNNWANNQEGLVSDETFLMTNDENSDVWSRSEDLPPGEYRFQFVVEEPGASEGRGRWFVPEYVARRDADGNGILWVSRTGAVHLGDGVDEKLRPQKDGQTVTFRLRAPEAVMVFLAGEFNNWADNRDGFVVSQDAAMDGPDADGVWTKTLELKSGTHHYQFVIDGETWVRDPNEEAAMEDHSLVRVQ